MTAKNTDGWEPTTYQSLLDENKLLVDENRALKDKIQSLRAYLKQDKEPKYDIDKLDLERRQAHLLIKADLEALTQMHDYCYERKKHLSGSVPIASRNFPISIFVHSSPPDSTSFLILYRIIFTGK